MPIAADQTNTAPREPILIDSTPTSEPSEASEASPTEAAPGEAPAQAPGATVAPEAPEATQEASGAAPTAQVLRREALAAQKAQRRAREAEARASSAAAKADRVDAILQKGNWQENPIAVLEALDLNPNQFYQFMTKQALREPIPESDPVQDKIKAALAPYEERERQRAQQAEDYQTAQMEVSFVANELQPVVQGNVDRWETIIKENDGDMGKSAAFIYAAIKHDVMVNGRSKPLPFDEAADLIEKALYERHELSLKRNSSNKKFSKWFKQLTQESETSPENKSASEKKIPAKTLTNQLGQSLVSIQKPRAQKFGRSNDAELEALIAKHTRK